MAETKATTKPVTKTERKKPVRKAPVQKDYPNKLAWLRAMTSFEESAAQAETAAKVKRLDKRIAAKAAALAALNTEVVKLKAERDALAPTEEVTTSEPEAAASTS